MTLLFFSFAALAAAVPLAKSRGTDSIVDTLLAQMAIAYEGSVPVVTANGSLLLEEWLGGLETTTFNIPANSPDADMRAANLAVVRENFGYETLPSGGPFYPSGALGNAKAALDAADIQADLALMIEVASVDGAKAVADAAKYGNLDSLDDYVSIYDGEWADALPNGPDVGVLTNYTQDLYFSMLRLSASPYAVRRLRCAGDDLPFSLAAGVAEQIAGAGLRQLLGQGRLFYADYRDQAWMQSTGRYAAAVDAYFYMDPRTDNFLPLAIRTNAGAGLVYTPLDSAGDWLLAKILYNINDFWFAQWNHLAATHYVVQIVWMAGIRTLSSEHPLFPVLNRLTYENFATEILAQSILFPTGGAVDLIFAFTGQSANNYTNYRYSSHAGFFQANYFEPDLRSRGLLGPDGPSLKHFPFYEDGKVIYDALRQFMESFVRSYYRSDRDVAADPEIQAWVEECNTAAKVLDFPSRIVTIETLVDVLTHIAHLVSTAHHTVNTNELLQVSSTLPFNPPALYQELPTEKSADTDPVDFLPPLANVLEQLVIGTLFARPFLVNTNRTLTYMFDDAAMLAHMNAETQQANRVFMDSMQQMSQRVNARAFDQQGLSQGMPFLWKALDPNVAPYSLTV